MNEYLSATLNKKIILVAWWGHCFTLFHYNKKVLGSNPVWRLSVCNVCVRLCIHWFFLGVWLLPSAQYCKSKMITALFSCSSKILLCNKLS